MDAFVLVIIRFVVFRKASLFPIEPPYHKTRGGNKIQTFEIERARIFGLMKRHENEM